MAIAFGAGLVLCARVTEYFGRMMESGVMCYLAIAVEVIGILNIIIGAADISRRMDKVNYKVDAEHKRNLHNHKIFSACLRAIASRMSGTEGSSENGDCPGCVRRDEQSASLSRPLPPEETSDAAD